MHQILINYIYYIRKHPAHKSHFQWCKYHGWHDQVCKTQDGSFLFLWNNQIFCYSIYIPIFLGYRLCAFSQNPAAKTLNPKKIRADDDNAVNVDVPVCQKGMDFFLKHTILFSLIQKHERNGSQFQNSYESHCPHKQTKSTCCLQKQYFQMGNCCHYMIHETGDKDHTSFRI